MSKILAQRHLSRNWEHVLHKAKATLQIKLCLSASEETPVSFTDGSWGPEGRLAQMVLILLGREHQGMVMGLEKLLCFSHSTGTTPHPDVLLPSLAVFNLNKV